MGGLMARVLVLGEDVSACDAWTALLQRAGYETSAAGALAGGVTAAASESFDLVIVSQNTSNDFAAGVLRELDGTRSQGRVLILSTCGTLESAVEAMKLGAVDYVRPPADEQAALDVIARVLAHIGNLPRTAGRPTYATERWARAVLGLVHATRDIRTLEEWGREVGASSGTLRNWCRVAHLSPRRSLILGRLLRAASVASRGSWRPERLLNVTDPRTLDKLLALGGLARTAPSVKPADVLANQRLIEDASAISALVSAMSTSSSTSSSTSPGRK
jgi:ActR/RegA family two-component response regulator